MVIDPSAGMGPVIGHGLVATVVLSAWPCRRYTSRETNAVASELPTPLDTCPCVLVLLTPWRPSLR